MKKLTIALLMTIACSNAFGMQEEAKKADTQDQVQAKSDVKNRLIKGLAGLAGAGIFGYLSMSSNEKPFIKDSAYNTLQRFTDAIYDYTGKKIVDLLPKESKIKHYCHRRIGTVGNALIAFQCAKFAASNLSSVIAESTPDNIKQKLSSVRSKVTEKVQTNWKRPFSWMANKVKSMASKKNLKNSDQTEEQQLKN